MLTEKKSRFAVTQNENWPFLALHLSFKRLSFLLPSPWLTPFPSIILHQKEKLASIWEKPALAQIWPLVALACPPILFQVTIFINLSIQSTFIHFYSILTSSIHFYLFHPLSSVWQSTNFVDVVVFVFVVLVVLVTAWMLEYIFQIRAPLRYVRNSGQLYHR